MSTFIADPYVEEQLIRKRQEQGLDRWDEVWQGVYQIMPSPDDEHQDIADGLIEVLRPFIRQQEMGTVRSTVNVSDRVNNWQSNFRIPDIAFFAGTSDAENHTTFWCGGPDLAIEIISLGDRSREKLEFYESIGTRELLLIDRDPWQLELYRLANGSLELVGVSSLTKPSVLTSEVLPLTWRLTAGEERPQIAIAAKDDDESWTV